MAPLHLIEKQMKKDSSTPLPKTVDEYLALQPEAVRIQLEKVRQLIKKTAPEAEETISYQMPMYKFHGMLVAFGGLKNHCALYPCNSTLVSHFQEELKGFSTAPGTIRFSVDNPLPPALIKKIVKIRMQENLKKMQLKAIKKGKG